MLFPSATIGSLQVRLLLIGPDVSQERGRAIEITHRLDTIIGEGRTTIEERSAARSALLLSQRCTLPLVGNAADDWRKGMAALGERPVGVPLWIDALPVSRWAERIYDPQKVINFNPLTGAFDIYDSATLPGTLLYPILAPLMIGRWRERPAADGINKKFGQVEVTINEGSPWNCRIGINTQAGGWTAKADWSSPVKDQSEYGIELLELGGAVREPALDRRNAAARWRQEGGFTFRSRVEIRQHLSHFIAQKGAALSWAPVPAWFQPGADTPDTPDNYTARFANDTLTLRYLSGAVAQSTVAFVQEIDTGTRSQTVPSETYLYTVAYQHDASNPERYTNWDQPLVGTDGTFNPGQCAHKELLLSLRPQDVKADLNVAYVAGTLFADWLIGRLFGRVRVTVEKCDPANVDASRKVIFDGYVRNVLPSGNNLQVTATLFGNRLDRRVPSDVFGRRCNAFVFDARCKLDESAHSTTGTITPANVSSDGFTVTIPAPSGWGGATYADSWFGPNGILRTGSGRSTMTATILSSTMSGSALVVKLARPIFADMVAGGGQTVTLVPGCGGQYAADCGTKYANQDNFRAFNFTPDYIEQTSTSPTSSAKK